jgi:hypothetical protein
MTLYNGGANKHIVTPELKQRVCDLVMSGAPQYIIAEIIGIDEDTLKKHYKRELNTAKTEAIERIGKTVYQQALEGNEKSQALYLKTQGASHGWVEKQIVENVNSEDTQALKEKMKELEQKYERDY